MRSLVYNVVVLCLLVSTAMAAVNIEVPSRCKNNSGLKLVPSDDCTGFYMCVGSRVLEMPGCPPESSFSRRYKICVPKGSIYDDCIPSYTVDPDVDPAPQEPATIEEQCRNGATIIPHATECHLYYDCSHVYKKVPRYFEQYMKECKYPELFSVETQQCEHFENVKCGKRIERVNACDYKSLMCKSSRCVPCSVRMPSCEGKPDGMNVHEGRKWSPYFTVCYKGRLVSQDKCQLDTYGRVQLFNPVMGECFPLGRRSRQNRRRV